MPRKIVWFLALLCLSTVVLHSQHKEARNRLAAAHGQYYTPTASGLKSFHCDASIDWQAMLSRFTGSEIPDGSPALKALLGVHLAVNDDPKSTPPSALST